MCTDEERNVTPAVVFCMKTSVLSYNRELNLGQGRKGTTKGLGNH